jgi:hypothetical protein
MKAIKSVLPIITILFFLTSCGVQRVAVGNYESTDCKTKQHTEGKDISLFWEMVPVRTTEKKINITDYEKVVKRDFFDTVIFYGTAGIFSFKTVKINVRDCEAE